ncbi:MAG: adenylate kinase family protein [Candidatus Thorarchaeota archaeon]
MKIILVGGTPGTGKTQIAKALGAMLNSDVVGLGEIAERKKCIREYDADRETSVIDEDCLVDAIIELLEERDDNLIIEGHYIDLVPSGFVERVFILRTHPVALKARLAERKYSSEKITENIESEVFGVCQMDAIDAFGEENVFEVDTTDLSTDDVLEEIKAMMDSNDPPTRFDWMEELEEEGRLQEFVPDA